MPLEKTYALHFYTLLFPSVGGGWPISTPRRPTFSIEIPILLYRIRKGEWKIKSAGTEDQAKHYKERKIAPKTVRVPYPHLRR